jgi:hypothetical protein
MCRYDVTIAKERKMKKRAGEGRRRSGDHVAVAGIIATHLPFNDTEMSK